jgi:predicted O-linked N-acetylglucosamine transferase (SPINDLY family)
MNPQLQAVLQQVIQAFQRGNFDGAKSILNTVLKNDINSVDAIFELGVTYTEENRLSESRIIFNCLESFNTGNPDISYSLGFVCAMQEDFECALKSFDKVIKLRPNDLDALLNYASTLHELKRFDEALITYEKVLALKADDGVVFYNIGNTLHELKHYEEAITHFDKALSLKPDYAEAWSNKGITLNELKRFDEAIAHYDKALSLKPGHAKDWSNKGATLHELKRFDEAIAHHDKALSLSPDYAEAWFNKGNTLNDLKRFDEAITHYDKALSLKPDIDWVSGNLLHAKMKICSWSGLAESLHDIYKKVGVSEKVINSFALLALSDDAMLHKQSAEIYVHDKYPFNPVLGPILKRPKQEKIRIGYFSADFKNHPVAFLIAELFEIHDRSQFEIYAFSLVKAVDEMSSRLHLAFDHYIDAQAMSDIEIAQLSRSLSIDIAVDLTGITASSRTGIFSYRAAPIQVSYLGYPGTLGAEYIDYIIADKTLIPPQSQQFYSEKVVHLHNSYQVNDRKRLISDRQFTRQELGLPENRFVFCCFNNNFKILPTTFEGWMRILKAVEGSILWLFQDNSWAVENLKKEAEKQGVTPDRLVFAERLPLPEHLARHRQADLFLDTFPYNAHTTASDALWSGLPVLTLMGRSFASRVAASLLNAIDLPELITTGEEEYEALAIELALNPQKLAEIKLKLANNRLTTPLFDTPLFAKNLEAAYIKMYERYQADLGPEQITTL